MANLSSGEFLLKDLSLGVLEAQDVSQAIFQQVLEVGDIATHHEVHTGIDYDTQIPFIGTLGLVGKKILKCKPDANGSQIPVSQKKWTPVLIGDRFENCAVDANPLFKLFKAAQKINPDFFNKVGSEEEGVVMLRVEQAMREMLQRIAWFGDKTIDTFANGSYLTNGTDPLFFNMLDGFWKQIISIDIPTTSKFYVPISQNTTATYALQEVLPTDFAFNLFRKMYKKSDSRFKQLIGKGMKVCIHCTPEIAENWTDYREDKSLIFTLDKVETGGMRNAFRNIEIVPRYDWAATIQSYQDNGTTLHLPHRALMTTPENIPVGTVSTEDLQKLLSFYDPYHEVNVMDFRLKFDAKFLEDYLAVAAY